MSDTSSGGGKAAKPEGKKRGGKSGAGTGGGRARKSGAAASGAETGSTRSYTYASTDEAQKVIRRAVSAFAKAGAPLDMRLEGPNLTLRLPPKEQQTDEFRKLARRLKPKGSRAGKKEGGKGASEGGEGGAE